MWELLLELLDVLGLIDYKKKKKKKEKSIPLETNDSPHKQDTSGEVKGPGDSFCAGCHRPLEIGAIYEREKAWCTDCYKTYVLKLKE
ncbi:MAG: hypothetical protein GTO17_04225 [Candidatus Aminicenantes bacterium]|nr:hypothetical protein [Candidatus Aminicenantes bacterium]